MPIDTSIYQSIRPVEAPSMMDSAGKAMNLSALAMQRDQMAKKGQREEQEFNREDRLRKASEFGNALESMSGMSPEERSSNYPKVRQSLIQSGVLKPEEAPEEHDEGFYRQNLFKFRESTEGLNRQKTVAEINKLNADAHRKETSDPFANFIRREDYKEGAAKRKADEELKRYSQVGGWKLEDGATPTLDDAKKFKSGAAAARSLLGSLNEYQELVKNKGAEIGGKDSQRMESLARDIQLAAKDESLYGLGVLTGPDLSLLEEVIRAPTGAMDAVNPWAGSKAVNKAQQFREMLNTRIGAKAKTYGFTPDEEWKTLAGGSRTVPKDPNSAYAAPPIKHGTEEDGFVFMGGDPADKKNWKKAR